MLMKKTATIKEHVLLLKHTKLSEKDSENILKKYNILRKQLPVIFSKDAAISSIDTESGDIIEITRKSSTAGISKYYRVVVNA
ncbi:MAG: DNA-directed RNA polymerase subunit H [Nanoarchaeota archaeon]|nr:DNA-directed RNA polymerase subunit H [Nanoarchaeota archaeon]|tara:strand:+ start:163 stop:411 length:249 start_codon:yes stop_codon:yes gene_type:complete